MTTQLPTTCYATQDGGYFYFFAKSERDTDWRIDDNPTIHFVDSPFDPSFDQLDVCQEARDWIVAQYPNTTIIWE